MDDDTFRLLRESIRRYVEKEIVPKGEAWEEQGFVPREVLQEMGRLGYLGLRYPEEFGGTGLDARATAFPPPRQSAAMPRFRLRRCNSWSSVTRMRAPDAPMG